MSMNNIAQSNPEGELERLGKIRNFRKPEEEETQAQVQNEVVRKVPEAPKKVKKSDEPEKNVAKEEIQEKHKKWPVVAMVLAILMVIAGVVVLWILDEDEKNNVNKTGYVVVKEGNDEDMVSTVENEGEDEGDGLMELDRGNELVQGVYGKFMANVNSGVLDSFYINSRVMGGELTEKDMEVLIASSADADEMMTMLGEEVKIDSDDTVKNLNIVGNIVHYLDRAEKKGDELYFYEVALALGDKPGYYQVAVPVYMRDVPGSETISRRLNDVVVYLDGTAGTAAAGNERPSWVKLDGSKLNYYKWTFKKQKNGNYVYQGVEKLR